MWIFRPSKLHREKYVEATWIFQPAKLHREKCVEATWIFRPAKLHRKMYVETTWIFRPAKLHWKEYVETTWIFRPSKLHRKSTRKWRGNSSKFGLRHIDVIFTSNRRGVPVGLYLGFFFSQHSRFTWQQGKGDAISLTLLYHFHPRHRHLEITQVITAEGSPLLC